MKKRFTQQYGDEEGRCPSELSLQGTDTIPEVSVVNPNSAALCGLHRQWQKEGVCVCVCVCVACTPICECVCAVCVRACMQNAFREVHVSS